MGPPGGARNPVDPRFISLFNVFEIQFPSNDNLRTIYQVRAPGEWGACAGRGGRGGRGNHTAQHALDHDVRTSGCPASGDGMKHAQACTPLPLLLTPPPPAPCPALQAILSRHLAKLPSDEIRDQLGDRLTDVTLEL